jgi:hypothetical protein
MTLRMLDSTACGRATGGARPGAGGLAFGWRRKKGSWAERRNRAEWSGDLGRLQREWARAC